MMRSKHNHKSLDSPGVVILELPYPDLREAVDRLCRTFGLVQHLLIGNHRAQLAFGAGSIVVTQRGENSDFSFSGMVQVNDVNRHYERASESGARIINPPSDYPYGERQYTVEDLGRHRWTFSQALADVDPKTWGGTLLE